jgi:GAF domain-containing protein
VALTEGTEIDLGPVMAAAARTMQQVAPEELLQAVVDLAAASIPGFDAASVSMLDYGGSETTQAATDQFARELDILQHVLGEGPCIDAMKQPGLVVVPDVRHEQRWPTYVAEAVSRGVLAQMAIMVYLDDEGRTLGGLNIYSRSSAEVTDAARAMAELFATQAAVALGASRHEVNLSEGMASRQLIGQAVGIVMERYGMNEHNAFRYLIRISSTTNVKMRQVAQDIVDEANQRQS